MPAWLLAPLQLYASTAGVVGIAAAFCAKAAESYHPAHAQKAARLPPSAASLTMISLVTSHGAAAPAAMHHVSRA